MMMTINISDVWDKLSKGDYENDNYKIVELEPLHCYLSILKYTNTRCFELQIDSGTYSSFEKKFRGVEIYLVNFKPNKNSIFIYLLDSDLDEIFTVFIEDIIRNIENVQDEIFALQKIQNQFGKWEKLFGKLRSELLSQEAQRGLYGELTILYDILKFSSDPVKCITSWTGPEGTNQDFSNDSTALEVKTTKATAPSVNISNELQLDWTVLSNLFLAVIHVDEINNGSDTLEKLILQINERISNQPNLLDLFSDKLDRAGIPLGEESNYNKTGYIFRSKKFYRVQDGFPVLINSTINEPAIHNVKYQIDVSSFEKFETDFEPIKKNFI